MLAYHNKGTSSKKVICQDCYSRKNSKMSSISDNKDKQIYPSIIHGFHLFFFKSVVRSVLYDLILILNRKQQCANLYMKPC